MPSHDTGQLGVLRRPAALAALAAAAAGLVAGAVPWLATWRLVALVDVTGTREEQVVATLRGAGTTPLVWLALAAGLVAAAAACSVALDLPLPRAERLAAGAAAVLVLVGLVVLALRPAGPAGFASLARVERLQAGLDHLPTGVRIDLVVRPGPAAWVLLGAAVVVVLGTTVATRRG